MRERFRELSAYQKFILIALAVMALGFGVLYMITIRREGFAYRDGLLMQSEENGNTLWSGTVEGRMAVFTVHPDKSVEYSWGNQHYGPYTLKEDPTAIPKDHVNSGSMTGIEIHRGGQLLFRGGVLKVYIDNEEYYSLYNEDGTPEYGSFTISSVNGIVTDEHGSVIDTRAPSVTVIAQMMFGPGLSHYGSGGFWFCGLLLSFITALSVVYADELFRWNMRRTIRNAEGAEPSDWYVLSRGISWTVASIAILVIYIIGLRQ